MGKSYYIGRQMRWILTVMAIILVVVYMLVSWRWEKNTKVKLDTLETKLAAGDPNTRSFGEQLSILREMAREGKASIPYLFRAINFGKGFADNYDWGLRELLYEKCRKYPKVFSKIITDRTQSNTTRWYAIYSVSGTKCSDALVDVVNSNDSYSLRTQAMKALLGQSERKLRRCENGLITILQEVTAEWDAQLRGDDRNDWPTSEVITAQWAMQLLAEAHSEKAVPHLIRLLDNTRVYASTQLDDGALRDDSMALHAHNALKKITGQDLPPKREIWEKYLRR